MDERLDRLEYGIVTAYANGDLRSAQSIAREAARLEWQLEGPQQRRATAIANQAQEAVSLIRYRRRECPSCGGLVRLNREGFYRRHFATQPDGRRHLCTASGHAPLEVVPRALRRLDL